MFLFNWFQNQVFLPAVVVLRVFYIHRAGSSKCCPEQLEEVVCCPEVYVSGQNSDKGGSCTTTSRQQVRCWQENSQRSFRPVKVSSNTDKIWGATQEKVYQCSPSPRIAYNNETGEDLAVKLEPSNAKMPMLFLEHRFYKVCSLSQERRPWLAAHK